MFEWNTLICLIDFELLVETCRDDKTIDGLVCFYTGERCSEQSRTVVRLLRRSATS